jgi:hypothetical protein
MDPEGDLSVLPQEMTLGDFESFITRLGKYPMQVNINSSSCTLRTDHSLNKPINDMDKNVDIKFSA